MSRVIHVHVKGWTQTLEASVTSASNVKDGRKIEIDYPVTAVTGVFDNNAGTGTNYWTVYPATDPRAKRREINPTARYIALPISSGLAAATNCWVTYKMSESIQPVHGGYATSGVVGFAEVWSKKAINAFGTEMTDKNTGIPEKVWLDPQAGGMVVKSTKIITNGSNISMCIYSDGGGKAIPGSYAQSNQDADQIVGDTTTDAAGQSFLGNGETLLTADLWLKKVVAPTGNAVCKIYASTGTDPNRTPTGAALATSGNVDVTGIGGSYALETFTFSTPYVLTSGTTYFLALEFTGDATNYLHWGTDTSSPTYANNNFATYTTSWAAASTTDGCFYVYTTGVEQDPTDSDIIYQSGSITTGIYIDNADWVIDNSLTAVWVGYVDTGGNATPASTSIELRGGPLI